MKTTKIGKLAAGALATALISTIPISGAWAAHRTDAEQAIAAAKSAHEQAGAVGKASADTASLIKQAEDLIPSKQYTMAIELANKAMKEDKFAASQGAAGVPADSDAKAAAEKAIANAEAARKKAASVGGEWRDTGGMIKAAGDLVKSGEYDKATKLATMAEGQGELGYTQATSQKNAGFPSYVHFKQ